MKDRKILVPLDKSPLSAQTVQRLIALKDKFNNPLTLMHVLDFNRLSYRGFAQRTLEEIEEGARAEARRFVAEQKALFALAGMEVTTLVKEGQVRETICALADCGDYDLLVVGRHSESPLRNLLFGQVTHFVLHHVKCPVLVV